MTIKVKNNFPKFMAKTEKQAKQFVTAATSAGAASAKYYAPVAYSNLVNSQRVSITVDGNKVVGVVGFYTKYARHLELRKNWKPKPPPKYGNKKKGIPPANAYNPNARPGFLRYGFENTETQNEIDKLREIFKV